MSRIAEPNSTPKIVQVDLACLVVADRLRHVDVAHVDVLVSSITEIGLQQPIHVWQATNGGYHLVAGLHRVRAAEKLGWKQIAAVVVQLDDLDRRRFEIAENLHRAELTALERDQQLAEWIRLTDQKLSEQKASEVSSQDATKPQGGRPESGVSRAARELNIKKDDAHRAMKVASLSPEARAFARKVGLAKNRAALLDAAKHPDSRKQVQALQKRQRRRGAGGKPRFLQARTRYRFYIKILQHIEDTASMCGGDEELTFISTNERREWAQRIAEALPTLGAFRDRLLKDVTTTTNSPTEAPVKISETAEGLH